MEGAFLGGYAPNSPVLNRLSPFLANARKGKIYKFFQGSIRCKYSFIFSDFTKLSVVSFHSICCVNDSSNVLRVLEVCSKFIPVVSPAFDNYRIILAPFQFKIIQCFFCSIFIDCLVNKFEVLHELLLILAGNILDRVTNLVNNTKLYSRFRINAGNRIWETF